MYSCVESQIGGGGSGEGSGWEGGGWGGGGRMSSACKF